MRARSPTLDSLFRCFVRYLEVKGRVLEARKRRCLRSTAQLRTREGLLPWVQKCAKYCDATGAAVTCSSARAHLLRRLDEGIFSKPHALLGMTRCARNGVPCLFYMWLRYPLRR